MHVPERKKYIDIKKYKKNQKYFKVSFFVPNLRIFYSHLPFWGNNKIFFSVFMYFFKILVILNFTFRIFCTRIGFFNCFPYQKSMFLHVLLNIFCYVRLLRWLFWIFSVSVFILIVIFFLRLIAVIGILIAIAVYDSVISPIKILY